MERKQLQLEGMSRRVALADVAEAPAVAGPAVAVECERRCQYAEDVGMRGHRCSRGCVYAGTASGADGPWYSVQVSDVGPWNLGESPPCSGWWDYRIRGTAEEGRLWFQRNEWAPGCPSPGGVWSHGPNNERPVSMHEFIAGSMEWRGLLRPVAEGYRWKVPGAARYKAKLR